MKKNLMSVIILALCFANLVLSAIIVFTLVPEAKKINSLADSVLTAVSLKENSGGATSAGSVPISEQEIYSVNGGETITTNLAKGTDGTSHYVVFSITLSLNKNSKEYSEESQTTFTSMDSVILSDINKIVSEYTIDTISQAAIEDAVLTDMQDMFGADLVIGVNISSWITQ